MPPKVSPGRPRQPSYRFHKARGCAVVTINGRNHYLGHYDSPESHEKYARLIAEWRVNGKGLAAIAAPSTNGAIAINALILRYMDFAGTYYVKHGQPTGEVNNLSRAFSTLTELYSRMPARDFGAKEPETAQHAMVQNGLARRTINGRVSRIKRMFRWDSRKGLVLPVTYHALLAGR